MSGLVLFLLKPGFSDDSGGPFFCPDCAAVEGFLTYAPEMAKQLDVRRIDFQKPRQPIVDLLGAANQGCPVLVLSGGGLPAGATKSAETGRAFISGTTAICNYLAQTFGVTRPHP